MTSTLTKSPIQYEPSLKNNIFNDDLTNYKFTDFCEFGIKCPCSNSKTIHRNKNSFMYTHCKTKKHVEYLIKLNENHVKENQQYTIPELLKQIKHYKIQIGKEHQELNIQKQRNNSLQNQIKLNLEEKKELQEEIKQANTFVDEVTQKNILLEKEIEEYKKMKNKLDKITREIMIISGYELENS